MALNFKQIFEGLRLKAKAVLTSDTKGELEVLDSDGRLYYHDGTTRAIISSVSSTDTITNKTIDATLNTITNLTVTNLAAGVLDTDLTTVAGTDTTIPSALAVKTYVDTGLAAQNQAIEITYDNTTSGLTATNVQAALDEIDLDLDFVQTILGDHIAETVGAHEASAISNIPAGNLAAIDVQAALNELQSDIDTRALDSALQAHINDATAAHAATAISVIAQNGITSIDVQAALEELQAEILASTGDVSGPASATDNAIARFDGTTGKLIQNSVVTVSDTGVIAGASIDGLTNTLTNVTATTNANLTGAITSVGNATSLGSFTSANLSTALTDETGTGLAVFNTSPTLVTPALGTPSSGIATNLTGLPLTTGVTGTLPIANGGTGQTTQTAAFDALSPMTTSGDVIYGGASGTGTRLGIGSTGQVLTVTGGLPVWSTLASSAPQIAVIRDEKTSGTAGGTNVGGDLYTQRVLNTLVNPSSIVTSLTSNQFTLPAGTYYIYCTSPFTSVDAHKIRLRNATDSTVAIIGEQGYNSSAANLAQTYSILSGTVTIASSKAFEIQYATNTAKATNGLGNSYGALAETEIYTQVFIIKL